MKQAREHLYQSRVTATKKTPRAETRPSPTHRLC